MAFIGNIFGAYAARETAKFNKRLFNQQSLIEKRNAEIKLATFNQVDKPRIIAAHNRNQSNMLVNFLKRGVDVDRIGGSPFLVMLDQGIEDAFEVTVQTYNSTVAYQNEINSSLILQAQGRGKAYEGEMLFRAGIAKAAGDIYSTDYGSLLGG